MSREDVGQKAERLLTSGAVRVVAADGHGAAVVVAGDTGTWAVEVEEAGARCSCPARGRCSHILATWLVVDPRWTT